MASNQVTEGEPKPDDHQIFETKLVNFNGNQVRIVTQDTNGPCPLIAVCNVLLLKNKFSLITVKVSADILLAHVGEQLCQIASSGDRSQDLIKALDALPRFCTGIDVNITFNKIDGFVDTPELAVFRLLEIPLYHGWMVDPQDFLTGKAFGSKPYNTVIKEVAEFRAKNARGEEMNVLQEDYGENQKGKGDSEEEQALIEALKLSSMDTPLSPSESLVPDSIKKPDESLGPIYEGLLMESFLESNKNQLTIYGLSALQKGLEDGELCVFFRNNHFNTMLKYNNELYVLATDQGYVSQPDLVWCNLNEVNGDTVFYTGDLEIFRHKTQTNVSSKSSVLSDKQLAADLQKKEYENDLQRQPTSQPDLRLTTGPQVEPDSPEDQYDWADDYWNDSDSEEEDSDPPIEHYETHETSDGR